MSTVDRLPLVPAAYVVLLRPSPEGDELLLHLRQHTGYRDGFWAAPAGHVDAGESVVDCAVREAREEIGVEIDPVDLEPLTAMHRTDGSHDPVEQRIDMFFVVRRWRGTPAIMEPTKAADLRWFPLHDLPDPVVPHERDVYTRLAHAPDPVPAILTSGFSPL